MRSLYTKEIPNDIYNLLSMKGAFSEKDDYTYAYAFDWCYNKGVYIYIDSTAWGEGNMVFHPHLYAPKLSHKIPPLHTACIKWESAANEAIKHILKYL